MAIFKNLLSSNQFLKPRKSSSLCLYPFFNTMVTANGKYKPCCKWSETLHHEGRELQAPKDTLMDAWNSDEMQAIRTEMLEGKYPEKCSVCWNEEKSGIRSMRFDSFEYQLKKDILSEPGTPKRLDLYLSNICNLKCRICSPEYSSKWIPEAKETLGIHENTHLNFTEENRQFIYNWLPDMVEIGLFGGEPFYNKECIELLSYCVDHRLSKKITLLINTNATIYSDEIVSLLKNFKKVYLNFSIDDIGKRFEYQRKGAIWNESIQVVSQFTKVGGFTGKDVIECKICCTVSALNIYYLPEMFEWCSQNFPGMLLYLNFLHGPIAFSANILPKEVKSMVSKKLKNNKNWKNIRFEKQQTRTIQDVIDFMSTENTNDFQLFFDEIERGDKYRKENFEAVFPEFYELIKPFKN